MKELINKKVADRKKYGNKIHFIGNKKQTFGNRKCCRVADNVAEETTHRQQPKVLIQKGSRVIVAVVAEDYLKRSISIIKRYIVKEYI